MLSFKVAKLVLLDKYWVSSPEIKAPYLSPFLLSQVFHLLGKQKQTEMGGRESQEIISRKSLLRRDTAEGEAVN